MFKLPEMPKMSHSDWRRHRNDFWAHKAREGERAKIIEAAMFPVDSETKPS